jgi:hypothetical protein
VYRSKLSGLTFPRLGLTSAMISLILAVSLPALAASTYGSLSSTGRAEYALASLLAQDDSGADEEDAIPTDQVDKYIAVYSAMQKNHGLSVEQASSQQGLTVDQFRTLEDRIERNPVVHQRVLDALKASATGGKAATNAKPNRTN